MMRGATLRGSKQIEVISLPDPRPGPNEVVVEVRATGVCGCSRERPAYEAAPGAPGPAGRVAGHESAGVVAEAGAGVDTLRPGQRVIVHGYAGCEHCDRCLAGWPQFCDLTRWSGRDLDGGWATHQVVTPAMCIPLPDELDFEAGTSCACTAATAFEAFTRMSPRGDETLMIYGVGSMGLALIPLAQAMGVRVIALEDNAPRRGLAESLGAWAVLDTRLPDLPSAIADLTSGQGADLAVDPTGTTASKTDCLRSLRRWGRYAVIGEHSGTTELPTQELIRREVTMIGSWSAGRRTVDSLARYVARRGIKLGDLVSHRFTLDQADAAFAEYETKRTGKVVMLP